MLRNLLKSTYQLKLPLLKTLTRCRSSCFSLDNLQQYKETYGDIEVKVLTNEEDLLKAKHFQYLFILQSSFDMQMLGENGGMELHRNGNMKYATDKFDNNTMFTGVFVNKTLICSTKIIFRNGSNALGIELLQDSKKPKIYERLQNKNLVQFSRGYVLPDYRKLGVLNLLQNFKFKVLQDIQHDVILTTNSINFFKKFNVGELLDDGFQHKENNSFDNYSVYYLSQEDLKKGEYISGKYIGRTLESLTNFNLDLYPQKILVN